MTTTEQLICPTCRRPNTLRHHCNENHPTCTWHVCRHCKAWGEPTRSDRWKAA